MLVVDRIKQLVTDPVESVFLQAPRALVASVLALFVDFATLEVCVHLFGLPAIPSAVIGYLVGGKLQYVLCSVWVFSTAPKSEAGGFIVFTILSLVGLGITWLVMLVGHEWAQLPVEIAKFGAVGLAFTWNFLSRKYLLFKLENAAPRSA